MNERFDISLTAAASPLAAGRLAALDGVRAISVLLVMFSHYGFGHVVPGGLGVTIFFFLSGFLITTLLLREGRGAGGIDVSSFYMRRLLRLSPELLAFMLVSGLGGALYVGLPKLIDVLAGLFYFTNYYSYTALLHGDHVRWPHLWSLAVEEHYYLSYPLLFVALWKRPRALAAALIAICLFSLVWRTLALLLGIPGNYGYLATEARIDSIAWGCLASLLLWSRFALIDALRAWHVPLLAAGAALLLATLAVRNEFFRESLRYSLQGLALGAIFVSLFASPFIARLAAPLDSPAMLWMGKLSYGAYIWHLEPAHIFEAIAGRPMATLAPMPRLMVACLAVVASFGLAYLSWRFVFSRVQNMRRRYGSHAA